MSRLSPHAPTPATRPRSPLPWLLLGGLLAVTASAGSAGCFFECLGQVCDACGPPVRLELQDAVSGEAVGGEAEVQGVQGACSRGRCDLYAGAGHYEFTVVASGYAALQLEYDVEEGGDGCCACGYVPRTEVVALQPIPQGQ